MISAFKVFVGFTDEEKWLNLQGKKGLRLVSVKDNRYTFEQTEKQIKYYLDHTDDSPYTDANEVYVKGRMAEGFDLVFINGRTLYFCAYEEKQDYSQRFKNMISHLRLVLLSSVTVFLVSLGVMLYELKQIGIYEHATFDGITPKTVTILLIIPAAISLGVSVMYAMETASVIKRKKEVILLEQQQDKVEQGSEGVQS